MQIHIVCRFLRDILIKKNPQYVLCNCKDGVCLISKFPNEKYFPKNNKEFKKIIEINK